MFRGLSREFDNKTDRLRATPQLTWDQAETSVLQKDEQLRYDRQRKGLKANVASSLDEASANQATAVQLTGQPMSKQVEHQFYSPGQTCSQCNKTGHVESQYFDTHPELKIALVAAKEAKAAAKTLAGAARSAAIDEELLRRHEEVFGGGAYSAWIEEDDAKEDLIQPPSDEEDSVPALINSYGDEDDMPFLRSNQRTVPV